MMDWRSIVAYLMIGRTVALLRHSERLKGSDWRRIVVKLLHGHHSHCAGCHDFLLGIFDLIILRWQVWGLSWDLSCDGSHDAALMVEMIEFIIVFVIVQTLWVGMGRWGLLVTLIWKLAFGITVFITARLLGDWRHKALHHILAIVRRPCFYSLLFYDILWRLLRWYNRVHGSSTFTILCDYRLFFITWCKFGIFERRAANLKRQDRLLACRQ